MFLDDRGQQGTLFDPFAATLRRRGVRTVRLTCARPSLARLIRDRLFYSDVVRLHADHPSLTLKPVLAKYEIVDVQFGEATLAELGLRSTAALALAQPALACAKSAPSAIFDKFELNARLAEAGIRAPPQIAADAASAQAAVEHLGLPLVVKRRVAEGGRGVHIAASATEAEAVLTNWNIPRAEAFFQKHIPGDLVMYGALVGDAGPLIARCFRATALQKAQGPSARIAVFDDPRTTRAGGEITAIIGLRGLGQLDFIEDAEGQLWHIDANARCWGSMLAANAHGADFVSAYERLITGRPAQTDSGGSAVDDIGVHPHSILAAAATGSWSAFAAAWPDFAQFCRAGPGPAYAILIALKAAAILASRTTRHGSFGKSA